MTFTCNLFLSVVFSGVSLGTLLVGDGMFAVPLIELVVPKVLY